MIFKYYIKKVKNYIIKNSVIQVLFYYKYYFSKKNIYSEFSQGF